MEEEHRIGARESPAQRVAATIEAQPPVKPANPVLAQQFSKLMVRSQQQNGEARQSEEEQESPAWDDLKQRGFRFAEKVIAADAFMHQIGERQDERGGNDTSEDSMENTSLDATSQIGRTSRQLLQRVGESLLGDRAASELANELAECVRQARHLGATWRVEIRLSTAQLPATRLYIHCDESQLHLRFVCDDQRARHMLENSAMLLQARLSTVSARPVILEIEQTSNTTGYDAMAGGAA